MIRFSDLKDYFRNYATINYQTEVLGLKIRDICYSVCIIDNHSESNQYSVVDKNGF